MASDPTDRFSLRLPNGAMVPHEHLEFRATGSSGPGGQHANKTATRVEVRIRVSWLPISEEQQQLVRSRLRNRINREDELLVAAEDSRSQSRNKELAVQRLQTLLTDALKVQAPRRRSGVPRGVRERILEIKHRRSQTKRNRSWRPGDDD